MTKKKATKELYVHTEWKTDEFQKERDKLAKRARLFPGGISAYGHIDGIDINKTINLPATKQGYKDAHKLLDYIEKLQAKHWNGKR